MVHGLAEQSGGRFILKSRPGEGTTAELWLPVVQPQPVAAEAAKESAAPAQDLSSLTILAVDDDALVLLNTVAMLEDLGHVVRSAETAGAALEILKTDPDIELVLTDQVMPQMTGLQLAKIVQAKWPGDSGADRHGLRRDRARYAAEPAQACEAVYAKPACGRNPAPRSADEEYRPRGAIPAQGLRRGRLNERRWRSHAPPSW